MSNRFPLYTIQKHSHTIFKPDFHAIGRSRLLLFVILAKNREVNRCGYFEYRVKDSSTPDDVPRTSIATDAEIEGKTAR